MTPESSGMLPDISKAYNLAPEFSNKGIPDKFDKLLDIIQGADQLGLFKQVSDAQDKNLRHYLSTSQIATLRTRLFLLGYLKQKEASKSQEKNGVISIDRAMRQAIGRFKQEAGLTDKANDNWVDKPTWKLMEELVSFEEPFREQTWINKPDAQRQALRRAVGVRLAVFGFLDNPSHDKRKVFKALRVFEQTVRMLSPAGLPPSTGTRTGDWELQMIDMLFDQQALVSCLASYPGKFDIQPVDKLSHKEAEKLVNGFVIRIANVELWLLGYDVDLERNYEKNVGKYFQLRPSQAGDKTLPYYVLSDFWRDSGLHKADALARTADGITGEFFKTVEKVIQSGKKPILADDNLSQRLYRQLVDDSAHKSYFRAEVWGFIKGLGSRMWDGLKRAWYWLKKQFSRNRNPLMNKVINVARMVFHFAQESFQHVKTAVRCFSQSIKYIIPGAPDTPFLRVSPGLDYVLLIPSQPEYATDADRLGKDLLQGAQDFAFSMQVLSSLLKVLITTFQAVLIPGAGWFQLILALIKIYKKSRALIRSRATLASIP